MGHTVSTDLRVLGNRSVDAYLEMCDHFRDNVAGDEVLNFSFSPCEINTMADALDRMYPEMIHADPEKRQLVFARMNRFLRTHKEEARVLGAAYLENPKSAKAMKYFEYHRAFTFPLRNLRAAVDRLGAKCLEKLTQIFWPQIDTIPEKK